MRERGDFLEIFLVEGLYVLFVPSFVMDMDNTVNLGLQPQEQKTHGILSFFAKGFRARVGRIWRFFLFCSNCLSITFSFLKNEKRPVGPNLFPQNPNSSSKF